MGKTGFFRATSTEQAVSFLKEYGEKAMLLAGGTDIMVQENQYRLPDDTIFIGIEDVKEMKKIYEENDSIHIGSMVTDSELIDSKLVADSLTAIHMAAKESASTQVRNRATIGGNVGTASPSGDLLCALVALDADAVIAGVNGERTVKVSSIPVFVKKTSLEKTDVIKEFIIKKPSANENSYFVKMGKRKAMTISIVSMAAKIRLSDDHSVIAEASVTAGACAPTPKRLISFENALTGLPAKEAEIEKICSRALDDVSPITDMRAMEWYRKEITQIFAKRAVCGAISKVKEV